MERLRLCPVSYTHLNTPVLAISDIVEYNDPEYAFQYQHGLLNGNVKIPANTLDSAKQYTVEVWGNNGYDGSDKLVTPVVSQAPEGRGTLLAWQDLNFKGSDGVQAANLPTAQDLSLIHIFARIMAELQV